MRGPLLLGALALGSLIAGSDPSKFSLEEKEQFLKDAKVVESKELSVGVTNSRKGVMVRESDGLRHDIHIQTVNISKAEFEGTRGKEINFRDKYQFNIAAYELDKLLGLNMTPPSIEKKVGGSSAAITWWIYDVLMTELERTKQKKVDPPDPDSWNKQMYIVRVFDQLIYNTDRNLGNLVITKDWKIWMIDHTRGFRIMRTILAPVNLVKCDRKLLARLRELSKDEVKQKMKGWLTGMEIDGLMARRDLIVKFFDEQVKKKGEAAVLYDYL